jgi:hypothetical protein
MKLITAILMALAFTGPAAAGSLEDDVAHYVKVFNGDERLHSYNAESFAWMGLSDPRIFDILEKRVLDEHEAVRYDKSGKGRVARYIRALGFSGNAKYEPTLQRFEKDSGYERYAREALQDLPRYRAWNPVISNRASFDPRYTDDVNRILNMLRADDLELKHIGAKRIYFRHKDEVLLEKLAEEVRANYMSTDPQYSDAIAWMLKALGRARDPKYLPLLDEALATAPDRKIRKYAQVALKYYR